MTAFLLGALGLGLSLVVPGVLARARWTAREPRAAVVLWQAVTLASVLSAIGVVLVGPEEVVRAEGSGTVGATEALGAALAVAALIVVRLLLALVAVTRRSRHRRARHLLLVDLLDRAEQRAALDGQLHGEVDAGTLRVLDGALPFAYCLPGRSPRVVVSDGALRVLDPAQVRAVLAHEQAHLRARHDLVLESFAAVSRAVPT
ncbi:M56 family metallopeptidase, partial [Kineococcus glutinatus]|uniref:M56 family metallopeptidase n=1 Tax=Kineococcus glutinatus TaxID=1070872 RepID=UPI0031E7FF7C